MKRVLLTLLIFGLSLFCLRADTDIMKLSEIKAGMVGEGKTIFKGQKIETFKCKVLGVLEHFAPLKNLIIVELESPVLAEAGIIAGMSGSPVYIDGKLIGAVAYGFAFSKRPIGGVTPIEDILRVDTYNNPHATIDFSNIKIDFEKESVGSIAQTVRKEITNRLAYSPNKSMAPIKLIGTGNGLKPSTLSDLSPIFSIGTGISSAVSQTKPGINSLQVDRKLFELSPADAVAVCLMRGDLHFAATGTVTHVDGKKAYLFGHPYFNLGYVDFPLHKAEVISVVPSLQESFKMATVKNMIGTVTQDRFSTVQAVLGKSPYMIPLKVFLQNRNRSFNVEVVSHPLLTPILSAIAMQNIFSSEYKDFGFQSLRVKGTIFIENQKNIIIDDLFSGPNAAMELGNVLLVANFFLMNNPDQKIKIQKIDFEVSGSERNRNALIDNVILNKKAFFPGELITITIGLKNERGRYFTEEAQIKAPKLKAGSTFYLMVADKDAIIRMENENFKTNYFPVKLNTLIRSINNLRKNNRIYIKLMTPSEGIFIKGHEYSDLPAGMKNLFIYNTKSNDQAKIKFSTITEYQYGVPAAVKGSKLFKLKIRERSDVQ